MLSGRIEKPVFLSYYSLLAEIEETRTQMVVIAMEKGFAAPETIEVSQQLDSLLNKLLHLENISKNSPYLIN